MANQSPESTPFDTSPSPPGEEQASSSQPKRRERKECPHCGGILRAEAVTCRFCGRDLFSANATQIVLSPEEWNTTVPQWMRDAEAKALKRWLFLKKLRRYQWHVFGVMVACGFLAILWRIVFAPPDPHEQGLPVKPATQTGAEQAAVQPGTAAPDSAPVASIRNPEPGTDPDAGGESTVAATLSGETGESEPVAEKSAAPQVASALGTELPPSDTEPERPADVAAIVVTAVDLATEFQEYRAFAEDKYFGETVRVRGRIARIDTTTANPYLILETGKRPPVRCLLTQTARKKLYRIKPGLEVELRGVCDSAFLEIILSDCNFVF